MRKKGERVIAIRDGNESHLNIYGEGVYIGDLVQPSGTLTVFGPSDGTFPPNPCIKLDRGGIVWGSQCWWGPVDKVKEKYKHLEIVEVDLPDNPPLQTDVVQ